jgi:hypothetical protein
MPSASAIGHPLAVRAEKWSTFQYGVVLLLLSPVYDHKLFVAHASGVGHPPAVRAEMWSTFQYGVVLGCPG